MKIAPTKPIQFEVDIRMDVYELLSFYKILRSIGGAPEGTRGIFETAEIRIREILVEAIGYAKLNEIIDKTIQYDPSNRSGNSIYFVDNDIRETKDAIEAVLRK